MTSQSVVRFPNFLKGVSPLLLDIVFFAYHDNRLPGRYRFVRAEMPATYRPESDSLDEAFTLLREVKDLKDLGEIAGVETAALLREVATGYCHRAVGCVRRLKEAFQKDQEFKNALDQSIDWTHFSKDLSLIRAILDSRKAYIGTQVLTQYLLGLESIQIAIGHTDVIESMCRKLRAITAPRRRFVRPQAPQTMPQTMNPAPAKVEEAPTAPETAPEPQQAGNVHVLTDADANGAADVLALFQNTDDQA